MTTNGATRKRTKTTTRSFGSGDRYSHDASSFYRVFDPPEVSADDTINECHPANGTLEERIRVGDATNLAHIPDNSVALYVTSPPYLAGKDYELNRGPQSWEAYIEMLNGAIAEAARVLEPGGRIAINVANLGRKPFRNLAAHVTGALTAHGFLLRGEHIWLKARGANGSAAWGTFRSPQNPAMRDLTERIIVASKGRFDRAIKPKDRAQLGLPHASTINSEQFCAWTFDLWEFPPESAKRVGHPAPFPVELPARLIQMHTWANDVVCDGFAGSATTALAAHQAGRRYVCVDSDDAYVELARQRLRDAGAT